jgi:hypothetical protein
VLGYYSAGAIWSGSPSVGQLPGPAAADPGASLWGWPAAVPPGTRPRPADDHRVGQRRRDRAGGFRRIASGRRPPPPGIPSVQHLHVDLISTSFGAGQLAAEERLGGRPGDQPGRPVAVERGGQPAGLRLWAVAIGNYL